jgi:hypothetical protein
MSEHHVLSRRDFGKLAFAAFPAAALAGGAEFSFARQSKPNSLWGGVPFGIFAPYRFGPEASDLDGALNALVRFGVSYTELSNAVVERYVGRSPAARRPARPRSSRPHRSRSRAKPASPRGRRRPWAAADAAPRRRSSARRRKRPPIGARRRR